MVPKDRPAPRFANQVVIDYCRGPDGRLITIEELDWLLERNRTHRRHQIDQSRSFWFNETMKERDKEDRT